MPTITETGFAAVLTAVKAQLLSGTGFPAERVNVTAWDAVPEFQGDQDVLIRVGAPVPHPEDQESKGRLSTRIVRHLEINPRTRLSLDVQGYDDLLLTDAALGHLQLEEKLLTALEQFIPVDANGNWLVTEPMRLVPSQRPVVPEAPPDLPREWGESRLTWEVSYLPVLTPSIL